MRILALDIGGLTQDILLFDSTQRIENCVKMVMPSPTFNLAQKIKKASASKKDIFFTGVNMGGGPSKRALSNHLKSGLKAYATPKAAATFDDDIAAVARQGVKIIIEKDSPQNIEIIETKDIDLSAIRQALEAFNVDTSFDAIGVAVLDHGQAPPCISDRRFRFMHLSQAVGQCSQLNGFAHLAEDIPITLTRMEAVRESIETQLPHYKGHVMLMDTPVAAAIGASGDRQVAEKSHKVIVNVGNFHTLAFHLRDDSILGFFEHHTRLMNTEKLDKLIIKMVRGQLTDDEIFSDNGHGSLVIESSPDVPFVAVTGPQRRLMDGSKLNPYFAAPYGDMMLTGCFGLVRAFGKKIPEWQEEIDKALTDN